MDDVPLFKLEADTGEKEGWLGKGAPGCGGDVLDVNFSDIEL